MADTLTANFNLIKPDPGSPGWDAKLNANMDSIDAELQARKNAADFAHGEFTLLAIAVGTAGFQTVAHGLSSDDLDVGMSMTGSAGGSLSYAIAGFALTADGFITTQQAANSGSPPEVPTGNTTYIPAAGNIYFRVQNAGILQDVTVRWWARQRAP